MSRAWRVATAAPLGLALALSVGAPAAADDLAVAVSTVEVGTVHLIADVGSASATDLPTIGVTFGDTTLSTKVEVLQAAPSPAQARAVVIVLDTSGSMTGAPLLAARDAALDFVGAVPADVEIGLIAVSDTPTVLTAPTADRAAVRTALGSVQARGQTALYAAVRRGAELLDRYAQKRLLVLSDGADNRSAADATPVTNALVAAQTAVDVVAFRAQPDGLARLKRLASATGGTAYQAANTAALAGAFRAAATTFQLRLAVTVTVPARLAGESGGLVLTADDGTSRRSATVAVQFASPAGRPPPGSAVVASASRFSPPVGVVLGVVFVSLLVLALLATAPLARSARRRRLEQVARLGALARTGARPVPAAPAPGAEGGITQAVLGISDRVVRSRGLEGRLTLKLDRAGMALRPHEWVALRAGVALAGAVGGTLLLGLVGTILGGLVGWAATGLYRALRESSRSRAFADQLPDALQLIIGSLRSGFSLPQAVDAVGRDAAPGPIMVEFGRAMAEHRLGADLGDALDRMAERTDNEDLRWAVMAIRIQRETGGNLAEVLETTVETIRERDRLRRHVRALSAEGRLSAYILVAMPIGLGLWMFLVRREYLRPLWTTTMGLMMLVGAVVLVVVGTFWMSRWVKVEV